MKILVYGAGVLGSLYAGRLQATGHEVTLLARGQRSVDLNEHGLMLEDEATGRVTITAIPTVNELLPGDVYDWILVVMRKNQVAQVLPALAKNSTPNVLFLINNAAGPDAFIQALGRERVVLGFPGAGGARERHIVRYQIVAAQPTTLGEIDGQITPRLQQIADALTEAGFPIALSTHMDAWLKTHVALVSPIANAIYAAGGDVHRLARTRDGLVLLIRSVREGLKVLKALRIPITPGQYQLLNWLPEPILVAVLKRGLNTPRAELVLARHANAARDEMTGLAHEFRALAGQSGVETPASDQLARYIDPTVPPLPDGSAAIPLKWRGLIVAAGLVALLAVNVALNLKSPRCTCANSGTCACGCTRR